MTCQYSLCNFIKQDIPTQLECYASYNEFGFATPTSLFVLHTRTPTCMHTAQPLLPMTLCMCFAENGELPSGLAIQELDVETAYTQLVVLDSQRT